MSLFFLERRREIEGMYGMLELVRLDMKFLLINNTDCLTSDNINLLELEEEMLLSKIIKLKTRM